ncbi:MAG: succinylglutamate desuccinylase/aspartoacylase family protein [Bacillota bacterium]
MFRKILLSVTIYPLVTLLFALYFWGECRNLSQAAVGESAAATALPAGADRQITCTRTERVIMKGTPWETVVSIVTAPQDGPVVMVIGGMHGDEPAGYLAAEGIVTWVIDRGTLVVIPRANVSAISRRHRLGVDQLDLNRSFPGRTAGSETQQLAAAIFDLMVDLQPLWVLDLHEAQVLERAQAGGLGQTIIYPYGAGSLDIVNELLTAVNRTIPPPEDHFLLKCGLVKGTAMEAADSIGAESMIIETWQGLPLELRVDYQRRMVLSLLHLLGVAVY